MLHRTQAWTDPAAGPADQLIPSNSEFVIATEYKDNRREAVASTNQTVQRPWECGTPPRRERQSSTPSATTTSQTVR